MQKTMAGRTDYLSALKRAIRHGNFNFERIQFLIKKSGKLYSKVLNDAVKSTECNVEVIKLLLDKGAELNLKILPDTLTSQGCTLEIIKLLFERGAKLYRHILEDAVLFGSCSSEIIKFLINKGAKIDPSMLIRAIYNEKCDLNTAKLLLDCGVLASSETLWYAINSKTCSLEFVKLLLERSDKLIHHQFEADFILETLRSKRCDKIDVVHLLLEYGLKFYDVHLGAVMQQCGGNIKFIKYVLENGMIINEKTFSWYTIDSSNVYASKILLQSYFVHCSETIILSQMNKTLSRENFFKFFNFADKAVYKEISDFFSLLLKEFIKMSIDEIDYDLTLFSYVSNKYSSACVEHKTKYSYANEILSRLYSKQYVYSCDVLYSTLSKHDVTQTLFDLDIFVKKDENCLGDKVSLNHDSIINLVSYLSRDDIINLILAYWHKDKV